MLARRNQEAGSVKLTLEWVSMQPDLSIFDLLEIQQLFQGYFQCIIYFIFQSTLDWVVKRAAHLNRGKKHNWVWLFDKKALTD